ncbi:hypothetical protein QKW35_05440 [Pontibacterium granulatum]|uniref:hypothetical protein n=1 Tax=Pontibacterium granulatum TaxID=2036029 RepID=UPI00249BC856|nr:hypothetical protein [Pontibacterium granulatum]MDI3323815.1 hypothetical protein [Pontibacterium granulatum]
MEHQAVQNNSPQLQGADQPRIRREEIIQELRRQAAVLRDEGETAADFWLAEQYETTADLLN